MADFHYYLNRQGTRGQRGEKGDTGFSPLITEKTNTKEEYVLHIQNETDDTSFDTPNLKEGLVPEDMGGTYVRLNRETGNQYYGDIDEATETTKGAVKLEPDETVLTPTSETSVITAEQAAQNYTKKTETQDLQNIVTANEADIATMKTSLSMKQTKLTEGTNITLTDLSNGTVRIDAAGGGGTGDIPIATTTTAGKVKPDGTTITITDDGTISAVGGGGSTPANMMTTDTDQTITGIKNFSVDWNKPSENGLYKGLKVGVLALGNDTGASSDYGVIGLDGGYGFKLKLDGSAAITVNHGNYYGESTVIISGYNESHPATIYGKGALSLKASGGNDKGLQITKDGVSFTNSAGETKDLLAGNIPTVIDGGDSTTV